jgi:Na+/proline symporter
MTMTSIATYVGSVFLAAGGLALAFGLAGWLLYLSLKHLCSSINLTLEFAEFVVDKRKKNESRN